MTNQISTGTGGGMSDKQFNDCVNAAVLAMDGKISRVNAVLVARAVLDAAEIIPPRRFEPTPKKSGDLVMTSQGVVRL